MWRSHDSTWRREVGLSGQELRALLCRSSSSSESRAFLKVNVVNSASASPQQLPSSGVPTLLCDYPSLRISRHAMRRTLVRRPPRHRMKRGNLRVPVHVRLFQLSWDIKQPLCWS